MFSPALYLPSFHLTPSRPAAELYIPGLPHNEQVGVAVGALLDENQGDAIDWLKGQLTKAVSERKAWEAETAARRILEEEAAADAGAELIPSESDKPPHISRFTLSIPVKPAS